MRYVIITLIIFVCSTALMVGNGNAQSDEAGGQVGEMSLTADDVGLFQGRGYSPYAGRAFPTQVYWGDTHLHTSLSLDARAFGVTLDPEQAYRFAPERHSHPLPTRAYPVLPAVSPAAIK